MKNFKNYPVILFFGILLYAISILDLFSPIEKHSELENRDLATFPVFKLESLIQNKYTPKIEDFTEDHFIQRNLWISLKSITESLLLKLENNGVVYGTDGHMFTKYINQNIENQEKNLNAINQFMQRHPNKNIKFILAPTAPEVLTDNVKPGSPVLNSKEIIERAKSIVGEEYIIDVTNTLKSHNDEYIYYRTDHHWTSLGAYYAFSDYLNIINKPPLSVNKLNFIQVPEFLGTHYSKAKDFNAIPDTLDYFDSSASMDILGENKSLYDLEKLATRDKYGMFLHGNNAFCSIKGNGSGKLLLIKDSYANCFIPYLAEVFENIDIVDPRFFAQSIDKLILDNNYEEILFLYNCETLDTDIKLPVINIYK